MKSSLSFYAPLLACCLLAACSGAPDEARRQAEEHYRNGVDIMTHEAGTELPGEPTHYRRSLDHFELAMAADSTFAPAYAASVVPYYSVYWEAFDPNSLEEARSRSTWAMKKAMELGPEMSETLLAHAVLLEVEGEGEMAEPLFQKAIEADPENWDAHREYAYLLHRSGRFDEALPEAERAVEIDPESVSACGTLATVLNGLGRVEEAVSKFRECIEMAPLAYSAYVSLGEILIQSGDFDGAIEAADAALELGQDRPVIRNVRAAGLAMKGQLEEALAGFEATGSKMGIGWVQALLGNRAEAEQEIEALRSDLEGGTWDADYDIGVIYTALGDKERAMEHLEAYLHALNEMVPYAAVGFGRGLSNSSLFDALREDSRFGALIAKTGYEPPT